MATQKYTNLAASTLASGYTAGDTTITLQTGDGAKFPSAGDFTVGIGSPTVFFLKCTSRSGDVLTVTSTGQEGTSAASKASGTVVTALVTAVVLSGIRADMMGYGAAASLPATSEAHIGDQYQCSDAPVRFIYDGSVWRALALGYPVTLPVLGGFTGITTTATTTDTGAGITIGGSNNTTSAYYKAAPGSTPFSVTLGFVGVIGLEDFATVSIIGRESATGKVVQFGIQHNGVGKTQIFVNKLNADLSFSVSYVTRDFLFVGGIIFLQIKDDGANRICQVSLDGQTFSQFHSIGRTDFITCNQFGWDFNGSTNFPPTARLLHWLQG